MSGRRPFSELTKDFTPEHRQRITEMKRELLAEMPLHELRRARALTQGDMAKMLKVNQPAVCKLEQRADIILEGFLPRFNSRFKVPPQESEVAYRAVEEGMCLDKVLCFKFRRRVARDNTVRYRWRTLQLLPGTDRPTYAGAAVDVLEGLDDSLAVQHEGRDIPSQEAPPRPSVLRGFAGRTAHSPVIHQPTNGLGSNWAARLATQDTNLDAEQQVDTSGRNGTARVRKVASPRRRKPTPLQTARWRAVQKAKRKGLSIRGIARELGIHRDTAKKYMSADRPPTSPARLTAKVS